MKNIVEKMRIISLKEKGYSNRAVAQMESCNRKTVGRYWSEYQAKKESLMEENAETKEIQEAMTEAPKYNSENRQRRKYTSKMEEALQEIIKQEKEKDKVLGSEHKQGLTKQQIHKKLVAKGFDIGITTIKAEIDRIRAVNKECFIRQEYEYGDRLEYDFGEVRLEIAGAVGTYHMAVLSSPGGGFRWSYLYNNQKKEVFLDSHVKFFEMLGGCYKEVVYDNMRNVVTRFLGKNEKALNEDLIKLSIYYGFEINVTNCFKGNEKGYVESSVKVLRNQIFATNYRFNSLEHAQEYLADSLLELNENSKIEEEKCCLLPYKPKLELAEIGLNLVNSYSFISVDSNFYSVPEYLVGKEVTVKKYYDELHVYANTAKICVHKRLTGTKLMQVDIMHYLNTFLKKPGAIRNSKALKSIPELNALYSEYYSKKPRKFIEILSINKDLEIPELVKLLREKALNKIELSAIEIVTSGTNIDLAARSQTARYVALTLRGASV